MYEINVFISIIQKKLNFWNEVLKFCGDGWEVGAARASALINLSLLTFYRNVNRTIRLKPPNVPIELLY